MLWTYGSATFQATWRIGSEGELLHLCCSCSLGCWPRCNLIPHSSSSGFVPKKQWSRLALKGLSEEVRALGLAFDDQARSSDHQILCWNRSASSAQVCPLISSGCTRSFTCYQENTKWIWSCGEVLLFLGQFQELYVIWFHLPPLNL